MTLLEMSSEIEAKTGIDLFDFALNDIINFETMTGSVADAEGDEIIEFKILTPKNKIEYFVGADCADCVSDLDIEVEYKVYFTADKNSTEDLQEMRLLAFGDKQIKKSRSIFDKELFSEIKEEFDLDFRRDQFINNQYGNSPCFSYDSAVDVIVYAYNKRDDKWGELSLYNLNMEIEKLRIETLKSRLEDICDLSEGYHLLKESREK